MCLLLPLSSSKQKPKEEGILGLGYVQNMQSPSLSPVPGEGAGLHPGSRDQDSTPLSSLFTFSPVQVIPQAARWPKGNDGI